MNRFARGLLFVALLLGSAVLCLGCGECDCSMAPECGQSTDSGCPSCPCSGSSCTGDTTTMTGSAVRRCPTGQCWQTSACPSGERCVDAGSSEAQCTGDFTSCDKLVEATSSLLEQGFSCSRTEDCLLVQDHCLTGNDCWHAIGVSRAIQQDFDALFAQFSALACANDGAVCACAPSAAVSASCVGGKCVVSRD